MIKTVISLIIGGALGAGGMYLYLNEKYEKLNAENLKKNREFYEKKMKDLEKEIPSNDISKEYQETAKELNEAKKKAEDLAAKLNYNSLYNKEPLGQAAEANEEDMIFLISPDQYDSETLLDKRILTYWEGDDILSDELSDEILDIENVIGIENVSEFGNSFEEDPYVMHIRNNRFGAVYEVTKDERSYSAVVGDVED